MNNIVVIDPRVVAYLSMRETILNEIKNVIKDLIKEAPTVSLSELDDE